MTGPASTGAAAGGRLDGKVAVISGAARGQGEAEARLFVAEGATVVLTRTSNTGVGPCVTERAAIGNRARADAAISIHADGGPPGGRRRDGRDEQARRLNHPVRHISRFPHGPSFFPPFAHLPRRFRSTTPGPGDDKTGEL